MTSEPDKAALDLEANVVQQAMEDMNRGLSTMDDENSMIIEENSEKIDEALQQFAFR